MITEYKNKLFSVLGDSISTFEGVSEPEFAAFYDNYNKLLGNIYSPKQTWWGIVIDTLGGELLVNNSISGSTVTWHPSYEIPSYACSDERTESLSRGEIAPDVIMVYIGTNDWGRGVRVALDEDRGKEDPAVFSSAYRIMLEKLKKNYPEAEIWCLSLAVSKCSKMNDFEFPYTYGERHISEYCDAIKECAEQFGCRFIDLYNTAGPYDTIDGFHANSEGMQAIAEAVLNELNI